MTQPHNVFPYLDRADHESAYPLADPFARLCEQRPRHGEEFWRATTLRVAGMLALLHVPPTYLEWIADNESSAVNTIVATWSVAVGSGARRAEELVLAAHLMDQPGYPTVAAEPGSIQHDLIECQVKLHPTRLSIASFKLLEPTNGVTYYVCSYTQVSSNRFLTFLGTTREAEPSEVLGRVIMSTRITEENVR